MSLNGVSDEVIEHARKIKNVPADWETEWCANHCGDFAFYPPGAREQAVQQGTPFLIVCSNECLTQVLNERGVGH